MSNQAKKPESGDEHAQGQSGYTAGRTEDDPALKFRNRNQVKPAGEEEKPEPALGTDDRFTGRGGPDRT